MGDFLYPLLELSAPMPTSAFWVCIETCVRDSGGTTNVKFTIDLVAL